ncbi:hypothetical protein Taro_025816 [Colocasia esculenta]|uniref:Uncharacterized protein n=1 Tax=Colocasia esculenta TaxID=4460 RepID=A0A843VIP1_COLES|nr:hypothetical protein [Colocasia esculenta]
MVPVASSGFPLSVVSGSMGGDCKNRVLDMDRGSGSRCRYTNTHHNCSSHDYNSMPGTFKVSSPSTLK